jgi:hypothetical protein
MMIPQLLIFSLGNLNPVVGHKYSFFILLRIVVAELPISTRFPGRECNLYLLAIPH